MSHGVGFLGERAKYMPLSANSPILVQEFGRAGNGAPTEGWSVPGSTKRHSHRVLTASLFYTSHKERRHSLSRRDKW